MTQHGHSHRHHYDESMLSVEEALERILGYFDVLDVEEKPILDAVGQVLAEDVTSRFNIPPMDNSAMDGYAVQAADLQRASAESPVALKVIGIVAAGSLPTEAVRPGTAFRIMTGAPVPDGADSVVPFEETDEVERRNAGRSMDEIAINVSVHQGADVRPVGEDVRQGDLVLEKGVVLRPSEVGVLASLGYHTVKVIRRPVVAILSTGNELLEPGDEFGAG